MTFLA